MLFSFFSVSFCFVLSCHCRFIAYRFNKSSFYFLFLSFWTMFSLACSSHYRIWPISFHIILECSTCFSFNINRYWFFYDSLKTDHVSLKPLFLLNCYLFYRKCVTLSYKLRLLKDWFGTILHMYVCENVLCNCSYLVANKLLTYYISRINLLRWLTGQLADKQHIGLPARGLVNSLAS